jgi:hypothetical protein
MLRSGSDSCATAIWSGGQPGVQGRSRIRVRRPCHLIGEVVAAHVPEIPIRPIVNFGGNYTVAEPASR